MFVRHLINLYTEHMLNQIADLDILSGLNNFTKHIHNTNTSDDYDRENDDDDYYDDSNNVDVDCDRLNNDRLNSDNLNSGHLTTDQQLYRNISQYTLIELHLTFQN